MPRLFRPCRRSLIVLWLSALAAAGAAADDSSGTWQVVGRQGIVRFVIVPAEQARNAAAYQEQIGRLCEPQTTCFLNFYTNLGGAPLALPLPDSIEHEATAIYRLSMKGQAVMFRWSCRMQIEVEECF